MYGMCGAHRDIDGNYRYDGDVGDHHDDGHVHMPDSCDDEDRRNDWSTKVVTNGV